jgi:BASS family bile acid:Na+ symporter
MDRLINILATVTLIELMICIGMGVTVAQVLTVARDWRMMSLALAANYLLVPAAAVTLLLLFRAQPMVAAGFLVAAVCPGAPYGPPFTALARGNTVVAVGLMVILAGSSAVVAPLLLRILLPVVAGDEPIRVDVPRMLSTLLLSQFLPLCAGLYLRWHKPLLADRLKTPAARLSMMLNLLLVGTIIAVQFRTLASIECRGYIGMAALLAVSIAAGALLSPRVPEDRKAMTMATSVRNVGVALVIATASFPGSAAVTSTTAYALFQTILMALVALAWGRMSAPRVELPLRAST